MSSSFSFSPVIPLVWLLPIALVLVIFFGWQEYRKPYRFKIIRAIAQALAILAVLGIMLRPSREVSEQRKGLIVLTKNYSQRELDSLRKADPGLMVVREPDQDTLASTQGALPAEGQAVQLNSYRELPSKGQVQFVLGDGIPSAYLETVEASFKFLPGQAPKGIVTLNNMQFPEQRRNWLTGKVRGSKGTKLILAGPGGMEDSVTIRTDALSEFQLRFASKMAGQYIYTLTIKEASGMTRSEEVPVEVVSGRKLTVLLLQSYPTAEIRFLKNYLSAKGHRLVTRYQVSKNIFRYEVANGAVQPTGTLDATRLAGFDLVVADNESMDRITADEARSIESAVRKGLGLLVTLNGLPDPRRFPGELFRFSPIVEPPDTIRYSLGSFGWNTSPFVAVKTGSMVQGILRSSGMLLQGLVLFGEGKVAVQTLRETYRLALGGDNSAYAALWTPLLEQSARREDLSVKLNAVTSFPVYPDEPVDFHVVGPPPKQVAGRDGWIIPLAEDLVVDNLRHGRFWPAAPGWTQVRADSSELHLFVSKPESWSALRAENQRRDNLIVAATQARTAWAVRREEMSPMIFFIVFVVCSGIVWVGAKV